MSAIYLLPCHGDNSVEITTAEAGRAVRCPCGKRVTVPTLREIQCLPRKEISEPLATGVSNWSVQQGVMFSVGLVLTAACLVAVGWLSYQRSQLDTTEFVIDQEYLDDLREQVMATDAADTLVGWNEINHPLPPERLQIPLFVANRAIARQIFIKMIVAGVVGVIGIGLMAAGVLFKPRQVRPRKQKAKRPAAA